MRRDEIEARVDTLADELAGEEFVAAVRELSERLGPEDRDVLGAVLLTRSRALEDVAEERARAKGWIRRTLDVDTHLPRRQGRGLDG